MSIIGMPLTCMVTRRNLNTVRTIHPLPSTGLWYTILSQVDAYIFLSGSCGSLSTTVAFLYVLGRFPRFIRHVKAEGADPTVVVRLATFYQLNVSFFRGYCVVQDGLLMSRADIACPSRVPVLVHSAAVDARG